MAIIAEMTDVLSVIDSALEERGLSDAAASRLAVGNPSLIKNLRQRRGDKRYNYQALERLADVLGLELYFGPPRTSKAPPVLDFAEGAPSNDLQRREALRAGFLPLPYHARSSKSGVAPIAFARGWLHAHQLVPDHLALVEVEGVPDGSPFPTGALAMVDSSADRAGGPDLWCYRHDGKDHLARLQWIGRDILVVHAERTRDPARVLVRAEVAALQILGRVRWIGAVDPSAS